MFHLALGLGAIAILLCQWHVTGLQLVQCLNIVLETREYATLHAVTFGGPFALKVVSLNLQVPC